MDELRAAKARSRLIAAVVGSDDPPKWLTDALDEYAAALAKTPDPATGFRVTDPMTDDTLRAALIRALAEIEQIDNPNTEPGGWWDKRIEPLLAALAASATDERPDREATPLIDPGLTARPAVPALDVERLSKALDNVWARGQIDDDKDEAAGIAAEYAALRSEEPTE